ncbi:uncharacterized protein LOC144125265 [Amblyomma americanum]
MLKVLRLLLEIRQQQREILQRLSRLEQCPQLPAFTIEDFEAAEAAVRDERVAAALRKQLVRLGGNNLKEVAVNVMSAVMGVAVQRLFSLRGRKGKRPFVGTKLCRVKQQMPSIKPIISICRIVIRCHELPCNGRFDVDCSVFMIAHFFAFYYCTVLILFVGIPCVSVTCGFSASNHELGFPYACRKCIVLKVAFLGLNAHSPCTDAICERQGVDILAAQGFIGRWLPGACDRGGGRKRRYAQAFEPPESHAPSEEPQTLSGSAPPVNPCAGSVTRPGAPTASCPATPPGMAITSPAVAHPSSAPSPALPPHSLLLTPSHPTQHPCHMDRCPTGT